MSLTTLAVLFAVVGTVSTVFVKSTQQDSDYKVKQKIAAKTSFEDNAVINAKAELTGDNKGKYLSKVLDSFYQLDSPDVKRTAKPDSEFNIAGFLKARKDSLADTAKKIR